MPTYEYRCQRCGVELELTHGMQETRDRAEHRDEAGEPCEGLLARLISRTGTAKSLHQKGPSDRQLKDLGFTKYVKRDKGGYEKAFGPDVAPTNFDPS